MPFGNRGIISQLGNTLQISNALVEEVSLTTRTTGFIVVSYVETNQNGVSAVSTLRLNVNRNAAILNLTGGSSCLCDIREGMWIDAVFSSRMTRSIPPQANAFLILVRRGAPASTNTITTRIISTDRRPDSILTGNPNNVNSQIRFILTDNTVILNRRGIPVDSSALRPGQQVRIVHANFQTASIPPQTTAFFIQIL